MQRALLDFDVPVLRDLNVIVAEVADVMLDRPCPAPIDAVRGVLNVLP